MSVKDGRIKIRKNVIGHVDMDYLDSLSAEDKQYMLQFTDEYYGTGYGKPHSLHREAFGDEYETTIKKQMQNKVNAENRCSHGITGCSFMLSNIDEIKDAATNTPEASELKKQLNVTSPQMVLENMVREYADEVNTESMDKTEEILKEYGYKVILLFLITKREQKKEKDQQKLRKAPQKRKTKPRAKAAVRYTHD